jgi:hypothetical protein
VPEAGFAECVIELPRYTIIGAGLSLLAIYCIINEKYFRYEFVLAVRGLWPLVNQKCEW